MALASVVFGSNSPEEPMGFAANAAPTRAPPGADTNLTLLLFPAKSGEKTLCVHTCTCVRTFVYA